VAKCGDRHGLLDDEILVVPFEDGLDFRPFMAGNDEEPTFVRVDALVFVQPKEDVLRAARIGALADEAAVSATESLLETKHLVVDRAKDRLVVRKSELPRLVHAHIVARLRCLGERGLEQAKRPGPRPAAW
jgi:hypothetical protein